jgi:hypothetical protein
MPDSLRALARLLACSALLIAVSPSPGISQGDARSAEEPLLGTWRLDLSKSRYSPGPPPRGETRTYARDAAGMKGTIDRHYADGRREVIDYRADSDHDTPVSGTKAYDAVRFRRVDARTTEAVLSHAGRVWGTARRMLSDDGGTLTITFRRFETGDMVNNVAVYYKEKK